MSKNRGYIDETASILRFAFLNRIYVFVVLVFHRAFCTEALKPFSRVVQEIRRKILQSCSKVYNLVSQSRLSSYFHACHDEITYFNRGVFPIRLP